MARSYLENPNYLYLGGDGYNSSIPSNSQFEFDKFELWDSSEHANPEPKNYHKITPLPLKKPSRRSHQIAGSAMDRQSKTATSLPVKIPDWSKILQDKYKRRENDDMYDDDDNVVDENDRIPPHVYLARTRMASLSVHEGVGRTLKGRDLSRVRNSIWKQTGFELD